MLNRNVKLQPHQQRAIERIRDQRSLVVAHGTGTGKTLTGIGGFEELKKKGKAKKALVVAPSSLRTNFAQHGVEKFTDSSVQVINKGDESIDPNADYAVVSSTLFASNPEKYVQGRDTLILDEAHNARNAGTKLNKALEQYAGHFENKIMLTASPFNNKPGDLVPLLNLAKGAKDYNPSTFDKDYVKEVKKRIGLFGEGVERETFNPDKRLSEDLRTFFDYEKGSGLPKTTEEIVRVPMGKQQSKAYQYAWQKMPAHVRRTIQNNVLPNKKDSVGFFGAIANARLASNNPESILVNAKGETSAKVKQLLDDLAEPKKTMVYSNYDQHGAEVIRKALDRSSIPASQISGKMNRKKKDEQIEGFKKGKGGDVFITTPTGKEGISLPNIEREVIFDPHWNPEVTRQAIGRGVRVDSVADEVNIKQYLAVEPERKLLGFIRRKPTPSVEEWIHSVAERKKDLQRQVLREIIS